jgi:hypothetical protein
MLMLLVLTVDAEIHHELVEQIRFSQSFGGTCWSLINGC